jgi:membrane-associated protein
MALHLGYLALAVLVGIESMGVPAPGETALIGASVLAERGHLSITGVIAVAATAAIIGDNAGYAIGRSGGRWLLTRPGRLHRHRARLLARGERFFVRHGGKAVFLARFSAGARVTAAWLAGANHMPWRTFLLWNALGGVTWAVGVGLLGFLLGPAAERIVHEFGWAGLALLIAVPVLGGVLVLLRRRGEPAA